MTTADGPRRPASVERLDPAGLDRATAALSGPLHSCVEARRHGRSLLVLDTVRESAGERLYRSVGYQAVGVILGYARSTRGPMEDTRVMFKALPAAPVSGSAS